MKLKKKVKELETVFSLLDKVVTTSFRNYNSRLTALEHQGCLCLPPSTHHPPPEDKKGLELLFDKTPILKYEFTCMEHIKYWLN